MSKGIIAAGNWIVDIVKTIDRFPSVGELCNVLSLERCGGGGPCNVLFDLAAMGVDFPLYAAGKLGADAEGDFLVSESTKRGINTRWLKRTEDSHTSYTDVMSGNGKRTFFHYRGANAALVPKDLTDIDIPAKIFYLGYLLLLDKLDEPDAEYGTGGARVLHAMQERGYQTVVDFVSEAPAKFKRVVMASLPYIDVLVINEIEAGNTFDLAVRGEDNSLDFDALEKASQLFFEHGVKEMVVFHYPEGAWIQKKGFEGQFSSTELVPADKIVGANGAGDAFCAGFLYGLHEELPLDEVLRYANTSASCNLMSATASGGAVSLKKMRKMMS
ncbi:MAG: carbohydrate kinase family protein [Lentisphaeria bacterium]